MRSLILGDFTAISRYERRLDEQGWIAMPRFRSALFFLVVRRRFGRYEPAEVRRFVAGLRGVRRLGNVGIEPRAFETAIGRVLDNSVQLEMGSAAIGMVETLVVYRILTEKRLSAAELDAILGAAERLAASSV
jgi:hypothetical protein